MIVIGENCPVLRILSQQVTQALTPPTPVFKSSMITLRVANRAAEARRHISTRQSLIAERN
ncbi:hypothetical protein BVI434_180075 [Burkholderia vietnamiensis]|nr:hypothetical protein BVI434_180075 [Burkholderia vietnamiensis]